MLLEEVFGLSPQPPDTIRWDVRQLEAHGVERYPLGAGLVVDLHCAARNAALDAPVITVKASRPVHVEVSWPGGTRTISPS